MSKRKKSDKIDSLLSKDEGSSTHEKARYEFEEASYVRAEPKKHGKKTKKPEGTEILDEITHKVYVEYGDEIITKTTDKVYVEKGKLTKTVICNMLPVLNLLRKKKRKNDNAQDLYEQHHHDPKILKENPHWMVSRGMTKQHLLDNIKEEDFPFTTAMPYINPALRLLKGLKLINTFREKPNLKTKFATEDAKETVQKLEKRVRMSSTDKLRLERAEKILGKKNEDAHPLYVFLTENGEKEITNFEKNKEEIRSIIFNLIIQANTSLVGQDNEET